MFSKIKISTQLIIGATIVILIALGFGWSEYKKQRLHKSFALTTAFIDDLKKLKGRGDRSYFTIKYNIGVGNYSALVGINCPRKYESDLGYLLLKRRLNLVYEKENPGNYELLVSRAKYQQYHLVPAEEFAWIIDSVQRICERKQ